MLKRVTISTGARLHFGLLAVRPALGRLYGGVGCLVDRPSLTISIEPSTGDELHASAETAARLATMLAAYRRTSPAERRPGPVRIHVSHELPHHQGLGSGTQIGLALATGLARLTGEPSVRSIALAKRVDRGHRSAIGLHGFEHGGLLVEGGQYAAGEVSPLVARTPFPVHWRFLLISPRNHSGLSGAAEVQAFQTLPPMEQQVTAELCRISLMELLPAAIEERYDAFAQALGHYGNLAAEYFTPVQGGLFSHPQMLTAASAIREQGFPGVGQSSWGPTLYALVPSLAEGEALAKNLAAKDLLADCDIDVVGVRNAGATIEISADLPPQPH